MIIMKKDIRQKKKHIIIIIKMKYGLVIKIYFLVFMGYQITIICMMKVIIDIIIIKNNAKNL